MGIQGVAWCPSFHLLCATALPIVFAVVQPSTVSLFFASSSCRGIPFRKSPVCSGFKELHFMVSEAQLAFVSTAIHSWRAAFLARIPSICLSSRTAISIETSRIRSTVPRYCSSSSRVLCLKASMNRYSNFAFVTHSLFSIIYLSSSSVQPVQLALCRSSQQDTI